MIQGKHRLRLKKQVLAAFSMAMFLSVVLLYVIVNSNKAFSSEVSVAEKNASLVEQSDVNENYSNYYIDLFQSQMDLRKKDNTVIYYAQKFKLNIIKTLELVHMYTNNYSDANYLSNFVIGPDWIKQREGAFPSMEAGIVYFVRDLYRYPEYYGSSIAEIRTTEERDLDHRIRDGVVHMDNGLTYEQYMGRIADMFGVDKSIALAISYLETGNLTSDLFVYSNNVGGQRGYEGWMFYTTLEAGVIGHVLAIRGMINNYGLDMNSETIVSDLSAIYVNGRLGIPSYDWTNKVQTFIEMINEKGLFNVE